jgi:hypothetical protein
MIISRGEEEDMSPIILCNRAGNSAHIRFIRLPGIMTS